MPQNCQSLARDGVLNMSPWSVRKIPSPPLSLSLSLATLQVSIHLKNWQQVLNYYSKAEATPEMVGPMILTPPVCQLINLLCVYPQGSQSGAAPGNQEIVGRLKCSAGLAEMENRKYKNAARLFLQANFDDCKCLDVSDFKHPTPPPLSSSSSVDCLCMNIAAVSPLCCSVRRAVCALGLLR